MGARAVKSYRGLTDGADDAPAARPFLKWAGGKGQLLPEIIKRLPPKFGRYFEPFLGGGAVFFAVAPKQALLSDINEELVNAYEVVRDDVGRLITSLSRHRFDQKVYYRVRNADRLPGFPRWSPVRRASRFLYLNKTCFNGLYRVNSKGQFNTPMGDYVAPRIVDPENLRACSEALAKVRLSVGGFLDIEDEVRAGDFVYLDPPYAPLSPTSNFTGYSAAGFGPDQQQALFDFCRRLDRRGVRFMLSNSSADWLRKLWSSKFKVELVPAGRAINANARRRGPVMEILARNY